MAAWVSFAVVPSSVVAWVTFAALPSLATPWSSAGNAFLLAAVVPCTYSGSEGIHCHTRLGVVEHQQQSYQGSSGDPFSRS